MQLRSARGVPGPDQPYWGCSRYPDCRETVAASPGAYHATAAASLADSTYNRQAIPLSLAAAPRQAEHQCSFFQACGLPAGLVETLHAEDLDRRLVRALAQWRLDFPLPRLEGVSRELRNIVAVAEAILTRGSTPLCSPTLERTLAGKVVGLLDDNQGIVDAIRRVALVPSCRFRPLSFDSAEERKAFEWILGEIRSQELAWLLTPQVELASLAADDGAFSGERVDFLLTHPEHDPVVVEIDGSAHMAHAQRDGRRDRSLRLAGVRVARITASEVRNGRGSGLGKLKEILSAGRGRTLAETELSRTLRWFKFCHQVQLALLEALRGGWLELEGISNIAVVPPGVLRRDPEAAALIRLAVEEFFELVGRLARFYGTPLSWSDSRVGVLVDSGSEQQWDVLIGPADGSCDVHLRNVRAQFLVSDANVPSDIRAPLTAASPARIESPRREDARWFLQYLFRKDDFWEGQWETIERTLRGLDSVVLLPTGGGKSIAFQLAALLLPGRCIVVDPIVSLIDDQIDNLARVGIDRCIGITSRLRTDERTRAIEAFRSGQYLFCYIAPERLQTVPFREALRALTVSTPISLIAIDEAHCVSEWGHDFRTAYLNVGRISRDYCASHGVVPPLVALTGTASRIVLKDVQRELGITSFDAIITPKSFDRKELEYLVLTSRSEEKVQRLLGFLDRLPTEFGIDRSRFFRPAGKQTRAGLVFCPHVNGPYGVAQQAEQLGRALGVRVGVYSGEPPHDVDSVRWEHTKRKVALDFKRNRFALLACTKAFGMGIDKPNIRYTIHIGLPASIESFYQEAGRAGRDRRRALCAIILSNDDRRRSQRLLSPATSLEEVADVVNRTDWGSADDIVRALWFHLRAFRGKQTELDDVALMVDALGELRTRRQVNISWDEKCWSADDGKERGAAQQRAEKALHRLVVLGVVEDYTVDFASREFGVIISGATQEEIALALGRYVRLYQQRLGEQAEREALALRRESHREYVLAVAERLLDFIYQHIELARRRALNEMLQAAVVARDGEDLRRRILDYLEQSEWDERLEAVRTSALGGVDRLAAVLDELVSPNDAVALRAAAGRLLASYPDVPGLLLLRSVSEALSPDGDRGVVRQNLDAALMFAVEKFRLSPTDIASGVGYALTRAHTKSGTGELLMRSILESPYAGRAVVRTLIQHVPSELAGLAVEWLLDTLSARCVALVTQ